MIQISFGMKYTNLSVRLKTRPITRRSQSNYFKIVLQSKPNARLLIQKFILTLNLLWKKINDSTQLHRGHSLAIQNSCSEKIFRSALVLNALSFVNSTHKFHMVTCKWSENFRLSQMFEIHVQKNYSDQHWYEIYYHLSTLPKISYGDW